MKTLEIFLSETPRSRAFIFGVKHYLVVPFYICSNYRSRAIFNRFSTEIAKAILTREKT